MDAAVAAWRVPKPFSTALLCLGWTKPCCNTRLHYGQPHRELLSEGKGQRTNMN